MTAVHPTAPSGRLSWQLSGRRGALLAAATAAAAPALAAAALRGAPADARNWTVRSGSWTATGVAVLPVGPADGPPRGLLRLSVTAADRLRDEAAVIARLRASPGIEDFDGILPVRWSEGRQDGWWWGLDSWLGGVDASSALAADPRLREPVLRSGAAAAQALHRATALPIRVGDAELRDWVDRHVDVLRSLRVPVPRAAERLSMLQTRLRRGLEGRDVRVGWVHGDLWRGNLRVDPETGSITGLIDWDFAAPGQLPVHDLLHLSLYGIAADRRVDLGTVLVEILRAGRWPAPVESIVAPVREAWGDVRDEDLLLLYWLRHVALVALQQREYLEYSRLVWLWRNVAKVLLAL